LVSVSNEEKGKKKKKKKKGEGAQVSSFLVCPFFHPHSACQVMSLASHLKAGSESFVETIFLGDLNIRLQRVICSSSGRAAQIVRNLLTLGSAGPGPSELLKNPSE